MTNYVLNFHDIDRTHIATVGGKAANLGELTRVAGLAVPPGFCVTTAAFQLMLTAAPLVDGLLGRLEQLKPDDREGIQMLSADIRAAIEATPVPAVIASAIAAQLAELGDQTACAVRSSATAEDLPTASFAGQQDTFLNVAGLPAILAHVSRCWASLYTERAVTYRLRNGFDQRKVSMAVVVQRMVFAEVAGLLFTADPISGNRKVCSIEASYGLGEALVAGLVNADSYKERDGAIIARTIGSKQLAIHALPAGGTQQQTVAAVQQQKPALTDAQVVQLAQLGRRIEAHFGSPQDIEWCLASNVFHIVQSRPITTLFPLPAVSDDRNHVYVSVGHQQMMTDAMKPLGISVWLLTAHASMHTAGGRLFVDVTDALASPARRNGLLDGLGKSDPLIGDALQTLLDRKDFIPLVPDEPQASAPAAFPPAPPVPLATDPAIVDTQIAIFETALAELKRQIQTRSGSALFDFILDDIRETQRLLFDASSLQVIFAALDASYWLNDKLQAWLGDKNAADTLTQSAPHNITSEMGLALLDVADVIRPHAEVVAFLQRVTNAAFLDELPRLAGGQEARAAICSWLDVYGMRCAGEIDLTRPRWSEHPATLIPLLLTNINNFEAGAGKRLFEQGRLAALNREQELLTRLRALPDGEQKALETQQMIARVRTFIGYREYPKYAMVSRYFVYKQALLKEADALVQAQVLADREDSYFLTLQEFHEVVRSGVADMQLIAERKAAFKAQQALTPSRVMTSEGELLNGTYRRSDIPAGVLVGLAVSAGTVEGRARVILDMASANLQPGDILVTAFTDPSWTPLFVAIKGLVTEVGGLMTHGAVIAREYGLPAVVGVQNATGLIQDGQRIRVHGAEGYVEILA